MTLIKKLNTISSSFTYWMALLLLGLSQEGIALYYQYVLNYEPCVLCIHVRIWMLGLIMIALLALWMRTHRWLNLVAHLFVAGIMIGIFERAWRLMGIERGTIMGTCGFDSGLPSWFALDKWFPAMFEVRDLCGYTPTLFFNITMAESLLVFSAFMVLVAILFVIVGVISKGS